MDDIKEILSAMFGGNPPEGMMESLDAALGKVAAPDVIVKRLTSFPKEVGNQTVEVEATVITLLLMSLSTIKYVAGFHVCDNQETCAVRQRETIATQVLAYYGENSKSRQDLSNRMDDLLDSITQIILRGRVIAAPSQN